MGYGIVKGANLLLDVDAMANAMVRLVMHRELRARLAIGARRTAERFGWERELDRLAASYREVLAVAAGAPEPRRVDELSVYASQ